MDLGEFAQVLTTEFSPLWFLMRDIDIFILLLETFNTTHNFATGILQRGYTKSMTNKLKPSPQLEASPAKTRLFLELSLIGILPKVNALIPIPCLVRFLADEVTWRIVLTDPNFLDGSIALSIFNNAFNRASADPLAIFPNYLSIVATDFAWSTSVSLIVVIIDFVAP